jgi:hypothetical protein
VPAAATNATFAKMIRGITNCQSGNWILKP